MLVHYKTYHDIKKPYFHKCEKDFFLFIDDTVHHYTMLIQKSTTNNLDHAISVFMKINENIDIYNVALYQNYLTEFLLKVVWNLDDLKCLTFLSSLTQINVIEKINIELLISLIKELYNHSSNEEKKYFLLILKHITKEDSIMAIENILPYIFNRNDFNDSDLHFFWLDLLLKISMSISKTRLDTSEMKDIFIYAIEMSYDITILNVILNLLKAKFRFTSSHLETISHKIDPISFPSDIIIPIFIQLFKQYGFVIFDLLKNSIQQILNFLPMHIEHILNFFYVLIQETSEMKFIYTLYTSGFYPFIIEAYPDLIFQSKLCIIRILYDTVSFIDEKLICAISEIDDISENDDNYEHSMAIILFNMISNFFDNTFEQAEEMIALCRKRQIPN